MAGQYAECVDSRKTCPPMTILEQLNHLRYSRLYEFMKDSCDEFSDIYINTRVHLLWPANMSNALTAEWRTSLTLSSSKWISWGVPGVINA
jgi:hypothetical protein